MKRRSASPNPRRVEAGRRNRLKWTGFTPEGLERLRQAALTTRPWERSTGPRTPEGKARSSANGKARQKGPRSVRELRAELAEFQHLIGRMQASRKRLDDGTDMAPLALARDVERDSHGRCKAEEVAVGPG